ncbi:hypothetical protein [Dentiradicibacter hellwigii]|uniref:hypothetical protein n=1 Tax=Dentiradicibacter hellwigii TaxID=3149053 RepID=UPI003AB95CC5
MALIQAPSNRLSASLLLQGFDERLALVLAYPVLVGKTDKTGPVLAQKIGQYAVFKITHH